MATVKAFKGLRYTQKAGELKDLCCPPYDIISESERQALLNHNENNIIRLELPRSFKDSGETDSNENAYDEAGVVLRNWLDNGVLADDTEENIYVYEFAFNYEGTSAAVKGFVGLVKLEEFSKGIVLPHEETLSKAKTDRFNLMTATGCNFSQIYSIYSDSDNAVLDILETATACNPTSEFTDSDGVTHRLWKVSDTAITSKISQLMADKKVFIADGHHRYETALNYRNSVKDNDGYSASTADYVPMMLVSMEAPGLTVFPTHRIVRDLPESEFDSQSLIAKSAEYFDITQDLSKDEALSLSAKACNDGKNAFVLYCGNEKYTLMILKSKSVMAELLPNEHKSLQELDVSVLHSLVLERTFGIDKANMAAQKNLTYIKLAEDAINAVDDGRANCCFLLNATKISEIRDVSLAGGKMPQKSTYFYPKLTTGLVMNRIFK